ncbi:MAG: hypothetical protein KGZ25_11560 [Planctomycetes bacterium]|nr:hypothetical protein [Planctomycetota bacterium]
MNRTFRADDWDSYRMEYGRPHRELEPPEREEKVVDRALNVLVEENILPHGRYDRALFLAHRRAVREQFEIPWTAITPRMQRFIYAINAIHEPSNIIAAGIFCGFTFICNAGAAVGPGACYGAANLIGVEIDADRASLARGNVQKIDPEGKTSIIAADAVDVVRDVESEIELLYLDADGAGGRGKGIYYDILQAALAKIPDGGLVLAHNSVNCRHDLRHYLEFVRDETQFRASVNVILDSEGLEVSSK